MITGDVLRMFTWTDEAPALRARLDALAAARRDRGPVRGRRTRRGARVARLPRHGGGIVRAHDEPRGAHPRGARAPTGHARAVGSASPGADATQAVSRAPADATQAVPHDRRERAGAGAAPRRPADAGDDDDDRVASGCSMIGGIAVVVVGVLAGVGIALATQGDDSTARVDDEHLVVVEHVDVDQHSTSTSSSTTTTSSTTTSTTSTTTTSTTVPVAADRVVLRAARGQLPGRDRPVELEHAERVGDDAERRRRRADARSGAGDRERVPFDCSAASHRYTLATTGGSPPRPRR